MYSNNSSFNIPQTVYNPYNQFNNFSNVTCDQYTPPFQQIDQQQFYLYQQQQQQLQQQQQQQQQFQQSQYQDYSPTNQQLFQLSQQQNINDFNQQQISSKSYTSFQDLQNYQQGTDIQLVLQTIQSNFEQKNKWDNQFDALDHLRILNKFYPHEINNIYKNFWDYIMINLESTRSNLMKNSLLFLTETLSQNCVRLDDTIIESVFPVLMQRSINEKRFIKEQVAKALQAFSIYCLYDISFLKVCESCFDKNSVIGENSIKILARMLENLNMNITKLEYNTLQKIMQTLTKLLDGKPSTKILGKEICFYIHKLIGNENYQNLMQNLLNQNEQIIMARVLNEQKKNFKNRESIIDTIRKNRASMLIQTQQQQQQSFGCDSQNICYNQFNYNSNSNNSNGSNNSNNILRSISQQPLQQIDNLQYLQNQNNMNFNNYDNMMI